MLRFSMRKSPAKSSGATGASATTGAETAEAHHDETHHAADASKEQVRVNYTSRAWLASLRKRTLSVESLSNMFSSVGRQDPNRKESLNSGAGSLTGGSNSKLLKTHKMQTKSGEPVEVYFGYDALSINGRSIGYSDVVFWSHSASHFTMTYLSKSSGRRKDVVLYPTEKGPKPSELTDMLGVRIARLVADQTGCSEEKAMRMATAKANEAELREAVQALDQHQQELGAQGGAAAPGIPVAKKRSSDADRVSGGGIPLPPANRGGSGALEKVGGSGMIELDTSTGGGDVSREATRENASLDGGNSVILEGDEAQPTPL